MEGVFTAFITVFGKFDFFGDINPIAILNIILAFTYGACKTKHLTISLFGHRRIFYYTRSN